MYNFIVINNSEKYNRYIPISKNEEGIKMAQPKRRWSKARTHSKRSTWKKENPTLSSCPHCHEPVIPHRVCKNCGYYNGKEVVAKKETENA